MLKVRSLSKTHCLIAMMSLWRVVNPPAEKLDEIAEGHLHTKQFWYTSSLHSFVLLKPVLCPFGSYLICSENFAFHDFDFKLISKSSLYPRWMNMHYCHYTTSILRLLHRLLFSYQTWKRCSTGGRMLLSEYDKYLTVVPGRTFYRGPSLMWQ